MKRRANETSLPLDVVVQALMRAQSTVGVARKTQFAGFRRALLAKAPDVRAGLVIASEGKHLALAQQCAGANPAALQAGAAGRLWEEAAPITRPESTMPARPRAGPGLAKAS